MKKIYQDIKKVFESKTSFRILCGIGIAVVSMLIFAGGVAVGSHKATFGHDWEEHYNENFGMGHSPFQNSMQKLGMTNNFPTAHGAAGKIIKIELPNIIVQDKENTEKSVLIGTNTKLEKGTEDIKSTDLKVDDFVVVIGIPDDKGVVEAKFVRVIPNPDSLTTK